MKYQAEGREWGRGSWTGGSKLEGLGSAVSGVEPRLQMHFGCTESPENASLVAANVI